jgi:protoporphyrinogen oxidase
MRRNSVAIIGAGPAGLTAAYLLSKADVPATVLEADPVYVGGIARTVSYKGFRFDIGGHRFFSKSKEVEDFWTEILPDDMLERQRRTRIYYRGRFFSYPLNATEAFWKLGIIESVRCVCSYLKARIAPIRGPRSFEEWVTNQFGSRLFNIFFKTYTEKVWGMSCKEISADWAAQRIKGLSLGTAILNAVSPKKRPKDRSKVVKTLIDSFRYPRKGPGMMWEACARKTEELGGVIQMGRKVVRLFYDVDTGVWSVGHVGRDGEVDETHAEHVICSAPMRQLVQFLRPRVSEQAVHAANSLRYRDFLIVVLILKDAGKFADHWIYIYDPGVKVARLENFKAWSGEMVPDPSMCCYGLEYFCFEGDGIWSSTDEGLIERAKVELEKIGLAKAADVVDGCVVRQQKAYPVYDDDYAAHVNTIREELEMCFPRLHLVGRNGMHKYNNQDHAMMTAMLTVQNILAGGRIYNPWNVNQDAEYHEAGNAGEQVGATGLRAVPRRITEAGMEPART